MVLRYTVGADRSCQHGYPPAVYCGKTNDTTTQSLGSQMSNRNEDYTPDISSRHVTKKLHLHTRKTRRVEYVESPRRCCCGAFFATIIVDGTTIARDWSRFHALLAGFPARKRKRNRETQRARFCEINNNRRGQLPSLRGGNGSARKNFGGTAYVDVCFHCRVM